jgi:hypothetical protein
VIRKRPLRGTPGNRQSLKYPSGGFAASRVPLGVCVRCVHCRPIGQPSSGPGFRAAGGNVFLQRKLFDRSGRRARVQASLPSLGLSLRCAAKRSLEGSYRSRAIPGAPFAGACAPPQDAGVAGKMCAAPRAVSDPIASGRRLSVLVLTRSLSTNRAPLRRNAL